MEIKRVTEDFGSRGEMSLSTLYEIEDIMYMIEMVFDECDTELANAGMPTLGYEKQPIGTMRDHLVILLNYVQHAHPQCYNELDHPLYVGFKNGATQALSEIVLEDITTDNTFEMQKYEEIIDVNGQYYRSSTKKNLTMKDFLGLDAVVPGNGMPVVENVETIGWFTALFRVDYESMGAAVESLDQMLEMYLHGGEFSHKEYHPVGNFVSGILDVTIIKPFIESIYGKDLITREKLTDFERGMQLVNAAVGAVTLGQGALALNFAEMSGKEIATALLKTWALEAVSDMSAYTVGYALDELGMPTSVSFLASLATGCSVSVKAGKYVFQDANSNIVKELDADGMQAFLKELDVDLGDMAWGGGKGTYTTSIDAYESLLGPMTDEELKRYLKFLEDGSQAGLTPAELMGIRKVDEYLALGRVDYDEVLALRKGVSGCGRNAIPPNVEARLNELVDEIRQDITKSYPIGNVGAAVTDIERVSSEIKSYSKYNNSISSPNINHEYSYNFGESNRIFDTKSVNSVNLIDGPGAYNRAVDSEAKILEDIAHQLGYNKFCVDETVKGNVYLITERVPCPSCQDVIEQFKQMFPNVNVIVKNRY